MPQYFLHSFLDPGALEALRFALLLERSVPCGCVAMALVLPPLCYACCSPTFFFCQLVFTHQTCGNSGAMAARLATNGIAFRPLLLTLKAMRGSCVRHSPDPLLTACQAREHWNAPGFAI